MSFNSKFFYIYIKCLDTIFSFTPNIHRYFASFFPPFPYIISHSWAYQLQVGRISILVGAYAQFTPCSYVCVCVCVHTNMYFKNWYFIDCHCYLIASFIKKYIVLWIFLSNLLFSIYFIFNFLSFYGCTHSIWRFPDQGSNQSWSHQPMPEPQQCGLWATSVTHTTADGNAGSLTLWARPGIKPASSWILVRFVNLWAMMGTLLLNDLSCKFTQIKWRRLFCIIFNIMNETYFIYSILAFIFFLVCAGIKILQETSMYTDIFIN